MLEQTGDVEENWSEPLPRFSDFRSSAHWRLLYVSAASWALALWNRSGLDWDTWEADWWRARRSKCGGRALWPAFCASLWGEDAGGGDGLESSSLEASIR